MIIANLDNDHVFLGRKTIYASREQINENTIPAIINGAMPRHLQNRAEIEFLYNYYKGKQPILDRVKLIRPDVNNRLVINNAYSIVRNANGYFLGEPIKYTAKIAGDMDKVSVLNAFMDSEDKACEDMDIGDWDSICGTGYRLVAADDDNEEDEAPFEIPTLDPRNTFVIYSTKAGNKPVLGVTFNELLNDNGSAIGTTFTVYDRTYQYIYTVKGGYTTQIKSENLIAPPKPHMLGDIPIVEYPNNRCRIGDFEVALTVLDSINTLHSDRVNSVVQLVNSILVFINCELEKAADSKDGKSGLDHLREELAIELKSTQGQPADVKFVNSSVDQNEAETLAQTLIDYVYAVTGIPDRKSSAGGGGDTGDAVFLRDGYQALEVVARIKERCFKKAERRMLRMVCKILKINGDMDLKPMQIDIQFVRNRTNNILNKSQALSNLLSTRKIAPTDAISLVNITEMPSEMATRGDKYWNEQAEIEAQRAIISTPKVEDSEAQTVDNSKGENNGYGGKRA